MPDENILGKNILDKKRALGRGLSELGLSELIGSTQNNAEELGYLPLQSMQPGRSQPRKDIDQEPLNALAESIRSQGVIQPIIVRKTSAPNNYEIIAGERRWRAAKLAGLEQIPAIIRDISDKNSAAFALIENIQREDLSALEEAYAFHRLINEFDMTHQQVADFTGKSRPSVSNLLRLLHIDPAVKILLENGSLEMGHARALLGLPNEDQLKIAKIITDKSLSVRATELMIQKISKPDTNVTSSVITPKIPEKIDPKISNFQDVLKTKFNSPVIIKHNKKGKGKLIIDYKNLAELEKIMEFFSS